MLKIAVLSLSFLLLGFHGIGGILPEIRDSLGITQTQSELLVTLPSIAILLFVIISNPLIEKIGMKKTVVGGLILSGIGGILPVFMPQTYSMLLASRFIFGGGLGLVYTSSVGYINILFEERERATLVGFRSAVELLGQVILTLSLGWLALHGWQTSFIVHGISFIIALLVWLKVPEAETSKGQSANSEPSEKVKPIVYLIALFLGFTAMAGSMVVVRFPAMVAEIRGDGYNSSVLMAMKPLLGILASMGFGQLVKLLGKKLLYIGLLCLVGANFLVGTANGNFPILVTGFLLTSFVLGWVVPITIDLISRMTKGKSQRIAMSLILVCVNISLFAMPFVVQLLENLLGSTELAAPYPLMGLLVGAATLGVILVSEHKALRLRVLKS